MRSFPLMCLSFTHSKSNGAEIVGKRCVTYIIVIQITSIRIPVILFGDFFSQALFQHLLEHSRFGRDAVLVAL
jgi:hypothetical protein